jgi:MarR family transcriptional regulator, transcriptional regulator for hemolysin
MPRPVTEPIGLQVARTAKVLSRAFDDALTEAGGSLPVWLVLVTLKTRRHAMQRELAEALGIEGPTLTHHLNRMETAGLVTRTRDRHNRRVHRVELTDDGDRMFEQLRGAAASFDRQLRRGVTTAEVATLGDLLGRLRTNAVGEPTAEVGPVTDHLGRRP